MAGLTGAPGSIAWAIKKARHLSMSSLLQIAGFSCVQTAFPQPFSQCLPLRLCSGFSCVHLTSPRCITQCCPRVFALVSPAPHTTFPSCYPQCLPVPHTVSPVIRLSVHEASLQCLPSHFLKHLHYIACRRKRGLGKVLVLSYELLF